jgi:hypothetical protein
VCVSASSFVLDLLFGAFDRIEARVRERQAARAADRALDTRRPHFPSDTIPVVCVYCDRELTKKNRRELCSATGPTPIAPRPPR